MRVVDSDSYQLRGDVLPSGVLRGSNLILILVVPVALVVPEVKDVISSSKYVQPLPYPAYREKDTLSGPQK